MTVGAGKIELVKRPDMVVNRDYIALLEACNLLDFDSLYHFRNGKTVKQIRDRSIIRMDVHTGAENRIFYLKRHTAARPGIWDMIASFSANKSFSPGMFEFENICDFRNSGIPTVTPVAAGERKTGLCRYESFLITESFEPYVSLEHLIYNLPERLKEPAGQIRKERLIRAVAHLARQMHDRGFNHRDFNATHVLVGPENETGECALALFDLQRMDRKKWLKTKWFIKIMAELSYTMPEPLFSDQDRLLLFQCYKGFSNQRLLDRLQLKWIRMKVKRIGKHTDHIKKRRQQTSRIGQKRA